MKKAYIKPYDLLKMCLWIILAIALCLLIIGSGKLSENVLQEEELFRIAEVQMFNEDYNQAILTLKEILETDPESCQASYYLSEVYLVKGLITQFCELTCVDLENSIFFADKVLADYPYDMGALFVKSLALMSQLTDNEESSKIGFLKESFKINEKCLLLAPESHEFLFARGEWWMNLAEFPPDWRQQVLNELNIEPDNADQSIDVDYCWMTAQTAFESSAGFVPGNVFGHCGLMEIASIYRDQEMLINHYNQVNLDKQYFPIQRYHSNKMKSMWEAFKQQHRYFDKNIPVADMFEETPL